MTSSKPGMTAQDIHSVYYMDVSAAKGIPRSEGAAKAGTTPASKASKQPRPAASKKIKPK